jgi:hypothetical protein
LSIGEGSVKDIDRPFFSEDGEVGDDLATGGEQFLKQTLVELVEGFGGHNESNVPLVF